MQNHEIPSIWKYQQNFNLPEMNNIQPRKAGARSAGARSAGSRSAGALSAGATSAGAIDMNFVNNLSKKVLDSIVKDIVKYVYDKTGSQTIADLIGKATLQIFQTLSSTMVGSGNQQRKGKGLKHKAKVVGNVILPPALDIGTRAATQALASTALAPLGLEPIAPIVGTVANKVVRKGIKDLTGYGNQNKQDKSVGVYKGGAKKSAKKSAKKPTASGDRRKIRGQVVKKLMQEEGLSFIEATKQATAYMKKHNI